MRRLFVGIEFPTDILVQLRKIQADLHRSISSGRFPQGENLHLTLQFLGNVADQQVPGIVASLREVACHNHLFPLSLGDPGVFGHQNPYRVVWLGLKGQLSALRKLQAGVVKSMAGHGFVSEHNVYRPHITLARDVTFCNSDPQGWSFDQGREHSFLVQHFALIASSLQGGKRIYRPLQHFYLRGP